MLRRPLPTQPVPLSEREGHVRLCVALGKSLTALSLLPQQ